MSPWYTSVKTMVIDQTSGRRGMVFSFTPLDSRFYPVENGIGFFVCSSDRPFVPALPTPPESPGRKVSLGRRFGMDDC